MAAGSAASAEREGQAVSEFKAIGVVGVPGIVIRALSGFGDWQSENGIEYGIGDWESDLGDMFSMSNGVSRMTLGVFEPIDSARPGSTGSGAAEADGAMLTPLPYSGPGVLLERW